MYEKLTIDRSINLYLLGRASAELKATLIVSRRHSVCVSETLMLNISETKRFRGSYPIRIL